MTEISENIRSVQFTAPQPKAIISSHSFSLLAEPSPRVELTNIMEEKASTIFQTYLETHGSNGVISNSYIVEMIIQCGYTYDQRYISAVIDKMYSEETIDLPKWLMLLEQYQAPAYNYGQRLRKFCGRGEVEDAIFLIVRGCDVNTGDGECLTSLHYACEVDKIDICKSLYALVGDKLILNCQDRYGWTPLHSAAHHGSKECLQWLLQLGADHGITEKTGKTPLHLAAAQARNELCTLLVTAGASLQAQDHHGMTPAHESGYKGHTDTFIHLSAMKGCDLQIKDSFGNIAKDYFKKLDK